MNYGVGFLATFFSILFHFIDAQNKLAIGAYVQSQNTIIANLLWIDVEETTQQKRLYPISCFRNMI